ncbi:baseplate wedge subunit [Ochrobactrum phage vB_OspM_OC]|nr:baseplate wedge subunit [Ochrobactrum phage vB_OspM_OC]
MTNETKLKDFISQQFPQIFREDGELLVKFIEYYYEWLQQSGNPIDVTRKINHYRDVDRVPEKFYTFLRGEFLKNLPHGMPIDETILYKNIKDFYRAKGSEKAFKLLFRILYNEDISFYYPADDILRTSDGRWIVNKTLRINPNIPQDAFQGFYTIRGEQSGAYARFEKLVSFIQNNYEVYEVYLSHIDGDFIKGEKLLADGIEDFVGLVESDGVITQDGYYEGTYGFLSSDKYLQDNYYYQEYSYVIKSSKTVDQYQNAVKNLVHPAGLKMFGSIEMESILDISTETGFGYGYDKWYSIILERQIDYDWDAFFDISSSFGTISRIIDIDYWGDRRFTNTMYGFTLSGISYNALTYSYFDESRNRMRGEFDGVDVGDVITISGEYINNLYDYKVYKKQGNKYIFVEPRFETQKLDNGNISVYKSQNNEDEIPYSFISSRKLEDKLIVSGAPRYSTILEYIDDYVVDLANVGIHDFDSGKMVRSTNNQLGVMAESRVYNVKTYDDIIAERIITNEQLEALANQSDEAIYVDTYPAEQSSKIFIRQFSKKYGKFTDKLTDIIDPTQIDVVYNITTSNDEEIITDLGDNIGFQSETYVSQDTPFYILLNNEEIELLDEDGNELTNEVDFDFVTFA